MSGSVANASLASGAISAHRVFELREGWQTASALPGIEETTLPPTPTGIWQPAMVPGTVAMAVGSSDLDGHADYDASDWLYRCAFAGPERSSSSDRIRLRFDGLATLSEIWLNGVRLGASDNMFIARTVDVTELIRAQNELLLVFHSLDAALAKRRPRPRWKTNLVEPQQLRWFRTTLLGRIPGWTPRIHAVGPWRPVWVEVLGLLDVEALDVQPRMRDGRKTVSVDARLVCLDQGTVIRSAALNVADDRAPLSIDREGDRWVVRGEATFDGAPLWWPHTHGSPELLDCSLALDTSAGPVTMSCGRIGFRQITVDRAGGAIRFQVNGVPVFCRGACWTTNDIVSLVGSDDEMRSTLETAKAGGANMVRVGGTMVYETDGFYEACDELGIMVWQDFMFANMDYPVEDADFRANVEAEVDHQLLRLQRHPCVAAYCGGSEVEQQAAMFGAPREAWTNDFFSRTLPERIATRHGGTPYWSSTPTGGALPFHVGEGLAHYYGVGAYRRPIEDVRTAGVRFTPECLGFSNVPEPEGLSGDSDLSFPPHHPAWKRGVPRDTGPGWDFEDIRDHYLKTTRGVDPVELRSTDLERYLALSRVVTGELMERVFDEWRSTGSGCGGGLVWFLRDLRPGAGWGILDSTGRPKAAYYFLKRAWASRAVRILDRGLDGLHVEVTNEMGQAFDAQLELLVIARGSVVTARAARGVSIGPRETGVFDADEMLGSFLDLTYSYRFGPPKHDAVIARLLDPMSDAFLCEAVYRPEPARLHAPATLSAVVERVGESLDVRLASAGLVDDVRIDVRDHVPEDDHFTLTPGRERRVTLHRVGDSGRPLRGFIEALNLEESVRLQLPEN